MEFSCLCSFSDPVTYLTDPFPFPITPSLGPFASHILITHFSHSKFISVHHLLKNSSFSTYLLLLPFSFNSLFTFQFVTYSKSSTGVTFSSTHTQSAYCSWQQKLRCSEADLHIQLYSYLLLATVWFSQSLSLVSQVHGWQFKTKKRPQNAKLFTCLFCFAAFSSQTIALSCLTCRVPASLWAAFTSSTVSSISFFRFFLCHSFYSTFSF